MSFGRRLEKRITPSGARDRPGHDREPEHEQGVREIEPTIDVCAHDDLAGAESEDHDEELRQVAERRLQDAGGCRPEARRPPRSRAPRSRRARRAPRAATTKRSTPFAPVRSRTPAATLTTAMAATAATWVRAMPAIRAPG